MRRVICYWALAQAGWVSSARLWLADLTVTDRESGHNPLLKNRVKRKVKDLTVFSGKRIIQRHKSLRYWSRNTSRLTEILGTLNKRHSFS